MGDLLVKIVQDKYITPAFWKPRQFQMESDNNIKVLRWGSKYHTHLPALHLAYCKVIKGSDGDDFLVAPVIHGLNNSLLKKMVGKDTEMRLLSHFRECG